MQITDKVSLKWLDDQHMTKYNDIAIPNDIDDPSKQATWVPILELKDEDCQKLDILFDRYVEKKQQKSKQKPHDKN